MNKKFLILFVIFSVFISISAVSADSISDDVTTVSASDETSMVSVSGDDSSFTDLNSTINSGNNIINITKDYTFNNEKDANFIEGILISQNNTVINGNNHIIDAENYAKIFKVNASGIIINDLMFKNANGSAINLYGELKTNNVKFTDCYGFNGGALNIIGGKYFSENDRFINNSAKEDGVIYGENSNIIINNGYFEGNSAGVAGSAITSFGGNLTVNNGVFENNNAHRGSVIYSISSNINISNSLSVNNHNNWSALYLLYSNINVLNTTFINSTSKYATAIYNTYGETNIKKSKFINLYANRTAGALGFKESTNIKIEDTIFINCSAAKNAGAFYADINGVFAQGTANISINNVSFEKCLSEFGGAYLQLGGNLSITNSNFTKNFAEFNGGAVYISNVTASFTNIIFSENNVNMTYEEYSTYGGAIFSDNSDLTVYDSKFIENSAVEGGALYIYDSNYDLNNLEFNGNENAVYTLFDKSSKKSNLKGTDEISDDDFNNTEYFDVISGTGMEIVLVNNTVNITNIPAKYDLRQENLVTPVRNQGDMGACWAFGTTGALESAVLKAMNYTADFSENNMEDSMLIYSKFGSKQVYEGGVNIFGLGYLLGWLGTFPQSYDTYDELGKISPLIRTNEDLHIQNVIVIPYTPGDNVSITNVKKAILNYGGLVGGLVSKSRSDEGEAIYYNPETAAQYNPVHIDSNHEVCIVGWDDNFSKDKFSITPPGDGAWIVKNSWGTSRGDKGYFYVSYYDQTLCAFPNNITESFVAFVFENTLPYNNNYQYDFIGISGNFVDNAGGNITYSNNFVSIGNDMIAAVGTYFNSEGVDYTLEISVNGNPVYTQNGTSPFYGYHTIKLDKYIPIKQGDNFTATITSNKMPVCNQTRTFYEKGSSYMNNGSGWYDLSEEGKVACLKVYTLEMNIFTEDLVKIYKNDSKFEASVGIANETVTFEINGVSYARTSDENGTAKIAINLRPGNYTIKTTFNRTTVENNIEILPTLIAQNLVKYFRNASQFDVSLIDGEGNAVPHVNITMNINGVFYNRTTNENGTARLNINLAPGEYILTALDQLSGLMMSYNITVLPVLNATDIEMTFKDGTQFKASVVDGTGSSLGGVNITFNINGIFYNRTTDENGITALNINLMAGKYIITSQYEYAVISNTITIRD